MNTQIVAHSTLELSAALQQLKELTCALEANESSVSALQSPLDKIRKFGQWLFATRPTLAPVALLSELPQVVAKMTQALPLISELQEGTPEQRDLAVRAIEVIDHYNAAIEQVARHAACQGKRNLATPPPKIAFSAVACSKRKIAWSTAPDHRNARVEDAFRMQLTEGSLWGVKERDLFHMKAIVRLVAYGLSQQQAMEAVRATAVKIWPEQEMPNFFSAVQIFDFVPGRRLVVTGSFEKVYAESANAVLDCCQLFVTAL